jgi:hypothetical protein
MEVVLLSVINSNIFKLLNSTIFMLICSQEKPCCFLPEVSFVLFIGVGYTQGYEFKHKCSCLSSHLP